MSRLLTTREASEILSLSMQTVYKYIHSGELPATKLGGRRHTRRRWHLQESDVIKFRDGKNDTR